MKNKIQHLGNLEILKLPQIAFLSSRKITSEAVLKCYDWATEMREKRVCVISGFHSKLEKDVLTFLFKGQQPIIIVLGRAMYKNMPKEWIKPFNDNRLLIISTNPNGVRYSTESAERRNRFMVSQAKKVVFGNIHSESSLYPIFRELTAIGKVDVEVLDETIFT